VLFKHRLKNDARQEGLPNGFLVGANTNQKPLLLLYRWRRLTNRWKAYRNDVFYSYSQYLQTIWQYLVRIFAPNIF